MAEDNSNMKNKKKLIIPEESRSIIRELVEIVLLTLILIIGIKNLIGEPRWIPTESMVPTLIEGDRVFIEKISEYFGEYKRGDIIVFYPPKFELKHDPWSEFTRSMGFLNNDTAYIKRLIGLPGDNIDVVEGIGVFVNGKLLDEPYVNEIADRGCGTRAKYCQITLEKDQYFMMGDNRNNSLDSRVWGPLPVNRVIGKAYCRWWPIDRIALINHQNYNNDESSNKK
ncbi:MAG: signal peptidase I [Cyanobacteriota bacterium]